MASYTLKKMKENLYFARLYSYPPSADAYKFLADMRKMVNEAAEGTKVYLVTDFRNGMFMDVGMLRQAAKLTAHEKFGASIGFGGDAVKEIFGDIFAELADQPDEVPPEMPATAAAAIAMLETLSPRITEDVDWKSFFDVEED